MENNLLIKGLWAGILISLAIGNVVIIPVGETNHVLMVVVASVTLIILILTLLFLIKRKSVITVPTPNPAPNAIKNISQNTNYVHPPILNTGYIVTPTSKSYYHKYDSDNITGTGNRPKNLHIQNQFGVSDSCKNQTFQLSKNSIFKIPAPAKGHNQKIFLEEHMDKEDQKFLKGVASQISR
jgi:hypothetical protein